MLKNGPPITGGSLFIKKPPKGGFSVISLVADAREGMPSLGTKLLQDLKAVFGNRDHSKALALGQWRELHGIDNPELLKLDT